MMAVQPPSSFPLPYPRPRPDCEQCMRLEGMGRAARAAHDRSGETDARVLLRHHYREVHENRATPGRPGC
ncbi:hypothetical protein [Streptomyces niger]|uniref:hypothetical protein n=1 Tax=Streptomyces niger TaxID=66373 RepID=UPI00069955A9|nr:hypothetical protein [Streptomyces niger]